MDEEFDQAGETRAEAAEWFARLKSVPVSRETLDGFFAWRKVEGNNAAFDALEQFWSQAGSAGESPAIRAATEQAYARGGRRRRWDEGRWLWSTAIAALMITVGVTLAFGPNRNPRYVTGIGERSEIMLDDGSKVTLDTGSALKVLYSAHERHIILDRGQAFFDVAHNAERPFTVETAGTTVVATGTEFEVRRLNDATEVTLVGGRVRVENADNETPTQLAPGQQARLVSGKPTIVHSIDTTVATAWKRGQIVLDGLTLTQAVDEVNRYTVQPIRLKADHAANDRLSGALQSGDTRSFIAAATALLPITAERAPDGAITLVDRPIPSKD